MLFFGKKSNVKKLLIEQSSAFEEEVYDIISGGIMIARDFYGDEVDSSEVRLFSAVVSVIIVEMHAKGLDKNLYKDIEGFLNENFKSFSQQVGISQIDMASRYIERLSSYRTILDDFFGKKNPDASKDLSKTLYANIFSPLSQNIPGPAIGEALIGNIYLLIKTIRTELNL